MHTPNKYPGTPGKEKKIKKHQALEELLKFREEVRLYEGRAVRLLAEYLMMQDKIAMLVKLLASLAPDSELSEAVVSELNQIRKQLEDLEQQSQF